MILENYYRLMIGSPINKEFKLSLDQYLQRVLHGRINLNRDYLEGNFDLGIMSMNPIYYSIQHSKNYFHSNFFKFDQCPCLHCEHCGQLIPCLTKEKIA